MTRAEWIALYQERAAIMIESGVAESMAGPKAWADTTDRFGTCPQDAPQQAGNGPTSRERVSGGVSIPRNQPGANLEHSR